MISRELPKYPPPMLVSSLEFSSMEWGAAEMCASQLPLSFARLSRFDHPEQDRRQVGGAAKVLPACSPRPRHQLQQDRRRGRQGTQRVVGSKCNRSFRPFASPATRSATRASRDVRVVEGNLSLEAVYLGGNKIGGDGANAISAALKGNHSPKIDVRDNALDAAAKEAVMTAVGNRNVVEGPELRVGCEESAYVENASACLSLSTFQISCICLCWGRIYFSKRVCVPK